MKTVCCNGVFDILHVGHISLLRQARALGDRLVVALNSDKSVKTLGKGPERPINSERDRRDLLLALRCVDDVVLFDEPTPEMVIHTLNPDVLVKGSDWKDMAYEVAGSQWVLSHGGAVVFLPVMEGYSTTKVLEKAKC